MLASTLRSIPIQIALRTLSSLRFSCAALNVSRFCDGVALRRMSMFFIDLTWASRSLLATEVASIWPALKALIEAVDS